MSQLVKHIPFSNWVCQWTLQLKQTENKSRFGAVSMSSIQIKILNVQYWRRQWNETHSQYVLRRQWNETDSQYVLNNKGNTTVDVWLRNHVRRFNQCYCVITLCYRLKQYVPSSYRLSLRCWTSRSNVTELSYH